MPVVGTATRGGYVAGCGAGGIPRLRVCVVSVGSAGRCDAFAGLRDVGDGATARAVPTGVRGVAASASVGIASAGRPPS